ncbi:30S ribosomal protein S12 methylthiotransferase RimO [Desulfovibrio oxyclinae]|jgi:ribosomal protein S12 methylthiotransferase|uniref:30S ribosomal protein S12 methylthiotransferase RimO n=1 Tax=Desulfovibrio oxyclinae TaxID=63560 RepID=UPI00036064C3|nr:30S ribosomal protein S12 methylthiotransferase RimO [Desulfovibrio oxyclinae]
MSEPVRVHTVSLGCPKNLVDTERLLGALGGAMTPVDEPKEADLVLVNTCGFIQPAIEESVETILDLVEEVREARESGKRQPVMVVAGCLVSRFRDALRNEMPEVSLWLSTDELDCWSDMIRDALGAETDKTMPRRVSTAPSFAYLKVGEGCSHNCRFCTIPSIRGPQHSFPLETLAAEARLLVTSGVPELVVVGQDSTAYGSDLGIKDGFRKLMDELLIIEGLHWLRVMYLYPAGLSESNLKYLATMGRPFVPYFDIPLQHAHPDILKNMGRPFSRDPQKVLERVKRFFPEAAIRTTFIVGFPGETEEHFHYLMDFVREHRLHHVGVFPYWPEEGTPAAELPDQVPDDVKEARRDALMALQAEISAELMEEYVGQEIEILVERPSPEWPGLYEGRAWFQAPEVDGKTYISVPEGTELTPGTFVTAEVESASTYDLSVLL